MMQEAGLRGEVAQALTKIDTHNHNPLVPIQLILFQRSLIILLEPKFESIQMAI